MPRRRGQSRRKPFVDPRFGNETIGKFINSMMESGKRRKAAQILYDAIDIVEKKIDKDPLEVCLRAVENVKPSLEVKSRRVGGSTYQVPMEVRTERQLALAIRWIIQFARSRQSKSMTDSLAQELLEAYNGTGASIKKKDDTHRMAEANKAFAHYRW